MEQMMSGNAIKRHEVLALIEAGALKVKEGAHRLGMTARQIRRIQKRYKAEGLAGLNSKRYGKKPGNCVTGAARQQVLECMENRYVGFGPTPVSEKRFEEHHIAISVESVRQMLIAAGHWRAKRGTEVKHHPLDALQSGRRGHKPAANHPCRGAPLAGRSKPNSRTTTEHAAPSL